MHAKLTEGYSLPLALKQKHGLEQSKSEPGLHQSDPFGFKVDIQSASDKSVIAAGVKPVGHGDISEYVPLVRHNEIDLIFSHSVGALPSPFPLRLLLEERVHQNPSCPRKLTSIRPL
jgi:hypothetical protein